MSGVYFKVGEEVTLEAVNRPDLNGDYFVLGIQDIKPSSKVICPLTGFRLLYEPGAGVIVFLDGLVRDDGRVISFKQKAIKKKYEGGQSLESLIQNLSRVTA